MSSTAATSGLFVAKLPIGAATAELAFGALVVVGPNNRSADGCRSAERSSSSDRTVERLPIDERLLHQSELGRIDMLRRRSHRRADEFRLGRIAAKVAIASVGITADPNLVCIGVGVFGQPVVLGDCRGVRVGIAHSGGYAASVAFDQSFPMGVDVEVRSERTCRVVSQHLGDEFIDRFVGHGVDPDLAPLAAWTGREALGKTLLTGLTAAEDVLSCRPVSSSVDQVVEIVFDKIPQYRGLSMVGGRFGLALTVPRQVLETDVELPDRLNRVVGPLCRSVSRC